MKKKKILVTGLNGFIGSRLRQIAPNGLRFFGGGRQFLDITKRVAVERAIGQDDVTAVLHLASKAHIDACENDRQLGRRGDAWQVNVEGAKNVAQASKKYGKYLLFLSSECVFDGEKGNYEETDVPNPKNWYGKTKYLGEEEVLGSNESFCVLRSVYCYGHPDPFPSDIKRTLLALWRKGKAVRAVTDQYISFTPIDELVMAISTLMRKQAKGIYHFAGKQSMSPFEFACRLKKEMSLKGEILPVTLYEYFKERASLRLKNATLSSRKIQSVL